MKSYNTEQFDLPNEKWSDLVSFPQTKGLYFISSFGRCKRKLKNKFYYSLGIKNRRGHLQIALSIGGKIIARPYVHDLVAEAFIRPLKEDEVVHHLRNVKSQNNWDNLCIQKRSEHTRLHLKGKTKSDEHKKKISISTKGRKHTEQWKFKQSQRMKNNTYMLGKHHSQETRRKMSNAHKKKVGK